MLATYIATRGYLVTKQDYTRVAILLEYCIEMEIKAH